MHLGANTFSPGGRIDGPATQVSYRQGLTTTVTDRVPSVVKKEDTAGQDRMDFFSGRCYLIDYFNEVGFHLDACRLAEHLDLQDQARPP